MKRFGRDIAVLSLTSHLVFALIVQLGGIGGNAFAAESSEPLAARVGGEEITLKAVEEAADRDLFRIKSEMYRIERDHLDRMVAERLYALEAEAAGKSVSTLKSEIKDPKNVSVTDKDVSDYYAANRNRFGKQPFNVAQHDIREFLEAAQLAEKEKTFLKQMRRKHGAEIFLKEPVIDIDIKGQASRGREDAPVTIVEFSDFQCPYCSRFKTTMDRILSEYPNEVRHVFRHNPLPFHQDARRAHAAIICAQHQGKFWEMRDALFRNQRALGVTFLRGYGEQIGLNMEEYDTCMADPDIDKRLDADLRYAQSVGARGTPTSFINGTLVSGAQPYEQVQSIVEEKLADI